MREIFPGFFANFWLFATRNLENTYFWKNFVGQNFRKFPKISAGLCPIFKKWCFFEGANRLSCFFVCFPGSEKHLAKTSNSPLYTAFLPPHFSTKFSGKISGEIFGKFCPILSKFGPPQKISVFSKEVTV